MDEQDVRQLLEDLIGEAVESEDFEQLEGQNVRIKSFEEACLLTRDEGLVLAIGDQEFQITIVRSK